MHIPVLLHTTITGLAIAPNEWVVDGTFGGGGHSTLIAQTVPTAHLICVDLDEAAAKRFQSNEILAHIDAQFVQANFKDTQTILNKVGVTTVQKVLLDLGTSSFQLDADTRGFSFRSDTPLAMTFSSKGSHTGFSAYDIVNEWEATSIADIIYHYGEDRYARRIAQALVAARANGPIKTSGALARVIEEVIGRKGKIHPATKTFQALRIAVNDELGVLKEALASWWEVLSPGGRIAVISFHSLEDRIVKEWIKEKHRTKIGRVITKKPLIAADEELEKNPRSRSAKLRIIEKI